MLEFLRKYQRYFFLVITVVVIASFTFFGTYSTFGEEPEKREDRIVGHTVDGSTMMLSDVQKLSRFIATDREDQGKGFLPNFCNDGVIRYDFIKDRLGALLAEQYFEVLKPDFASRLEKAKRFRSYEHPEAPFLSAKAVWDHFLPSLSHQLAALQGEKEASPALFSHLAKLYESQNLLQPETLRQILIYHHQQYPWLTIDQRLSYEDLALFGFHSASDWFGHNFVDLVSEFILNTAAAAEQKGYRVSLEEAKGDLIHHFQESIQRLASAKAKPEIHFSQHLRMLGFDERSACETWRKVLLFRRYFQDIGGAAFVDRLPYKDFAGYARETALVQRYQWPFKIQTAQDLAELEFYLKAVCPSLKGSLPIAFLSVEEVEKKHPELVETTYRAKVAEVSKKQVALKAGLKQVWQWEVADANWTVLRKQFSIPDASQSEERFAILERLDPKLRAEIDLFSREKLVDENPGWVEEALAAAPIQEKTWSVSGNQGPVLQADGIYYRIEEVEKVEDKHILPFPKARSILAKLVGKIEGDCPQDKNPFLIASQQALADLQKNPIDPQWIQSGTDPLLDAFKLEKREQAIYRTSQENWMKEQAFIMLPDLWSPIHVADDGQIVFFYLQEKKLSQAPILEQLSFGKETLAADAKAYVAERLLEIVKKKNAIVIPVQKGDE